MDDDVTELAMLRRRAYGPDADIDEDPVALARLIELESRAQHTFAERADPALADSTSAVPVAQVVPSASIAEPPAPAPRAPRRMWRFAIAATLAVVAVVLGAQAAEAPTGPALPVSAPLTPISAVAASDSVLVVVPLDRSLARYVPQTPQPMFPVDDGVLWAESIGPHYGWTVWLARSVSGQRCVLIEAEDRAYSRCLPEAQYLQGLLNVSVPYAQVEPDYRPARMRQGQSVIYRWLAERGLSIELEEAALTYFGDRG